MNAPHHNRLAALADDIKIFHDDITRGALALAERALSAGLRLIEAKGLVPHGTWKQWLNDHTGLSERTAQRYMQLARSGLKPATVADLGVRSAAEKIARHIEREQPGGAMAFKLSTGDQTAFLWDDPETKRFNIIIYFGPKPTGPAQTGGNAIVLHHDTTQLPLLWLRLAGFSNDQTHCQMFAYSSPGFLEDMALALSYTPPEKSDSPVDITAEVTARGISPNFCMTCLSHGLSIDEAEQCFRLSHIPEPVFDEAIDAIKSAGKELSTEAVLEFALQVAVLRESSERRPAQ